MRDILIQSESGKKGRSFRAVMLASVEADSLWAGGQTDTDHMRPVWAMFAGSDQELRAFTANARSGRKGVFVKQNGGYSRSKEEKIEFLKSVGYRVAWQKEEEGSIVTIYLPHLFQIDPGMVDPEGVNFVLLPTRNWVTSQTFDTRGLVQHALKAGYDLPEENLVYLAPLSYLFAAYLDRRTRCPLVADGRFFFQLMLSCLNNKSATFTGRSRDSYSYRHSSDFGVNFQYHEYGLTDVGLLPGLAFSSDHVSLENLLASEVSTYFGLI